MLDSKQENPKTPDPLNKTDSTAQSFRDSKTIMNLSPRKEENEASQNLLEQGEESD